MSEKRPGYIEALDENREVMYVCFRGRTRSPEAYGYAYRRGEKRSLILEGGHEHLFSLHKQGMDSEVEMRLIDLCTQNRLRVFKDDTFPSFQWLVETVEKLEQQGKVPPKSIEIIDVVGFAKEERYGTADKWHVIRVFTTESLND